MKRTADEIIKTWARSFITDKWDKINHPRVELGATKDEFLIEISKCTNTAIWVLCEVSRWGMKDEKDHSVKYRVTTGEDNDFSVFNLNGTFIKVEFDDNFEGQVSFAKKKNKTVVYWV